MTLPRALSDWLIFFVSSRRWPVAPVMRTCRQASARARQRLETTTKEQGAGVRDERSQQRRGQTCAREGIIIRCCHTHQQSTVARTHPLRSSQVNQVQLAHFEALAQPWSTAAAIAAVGPRRARAGSTVFLNVTFVPEHTHGGPSAKCWRRQLKSSYCTVTKVAKRFVTLPRAGGTHATRCPPHALCFRHWVAVAIHVTALGLLADDDEHGMRPTAQLVQLV
jgi:hypothetical protein